MNLYFHRVEGSSTGHIDFTDHFQICADSQVFLGMLAHVHFSLPIWPGYKARDQVHILISTVHRPDKPCCLQNAESSTVFSQVSQIH